MHDMYEHACGKRNMLIAKMMHDPVNSIQLIVI